ncbi:glycosyltransferase [Nesterenkonia sp. LB17]|uniref:glycosyltransferase n=1 Tax=unclassified Nesterenkonia TaxID=2629769 RepID=UPI001F4CBC9A|nr:MULTISPECIES: glycosyltransferase [unclassified Nesterenkonia]MCH8561321.1 glycosyltransferase [Nesterenkonia sp. DZ6]MCH8562365.1 glycosyltransferase [Nesterenkonia sp. YGD6]MCH8565301.1 glycosyltransferase [Nesterenkonia sp. LB17]MCH8571219.1 glycosyltransferase [Nesterenkonia sp. AY15]
MSTDCVPAGVCGAPQTDPDSARVVMVSLHTSPLAQAGNRDAGGLNVYVNALSAALAQGGITVDIVTTDVDAEAPAGADSVTVLDDGRRIHTLAVGEQARSEKSLLPERVDELAARALRSLESIDISRVTTVHSHYWISGLAGIQLARALSAPLVHTMHTIAAVKQELDPTTPESPRRSLAEAMIARAADLVTANTEREIADLKRLFGLDDASIALVRPGVDLEVFHPPMGQDPRCGPLAGRALRLAFAGRLQPHKGPQVAVEALGELRRRMPEVPVQLVVAGSQSGDDVLDLQALAERAGVADAVQALPPLPHSELADLFRRSDAVLVPSFSESFGLVALEAMACGTPVIAHDVGGLSSLITHRRSGRLIPSLDPVLWAEQLRWLVLHRRAWGRYSTTAATLARNYSWDATAAATRQAYRSLTLITSR